MSTDPLSPVSMRPFAVVTALSLLLGSVNTVAAATTTFSDVPSSHPYAEAIGALASYGIVKGNPDGTFKADDTVNRAGMLTLLYRALNKKASTPSGACFKDVPLRQWFTDVVCDASIRKYVAGYPDGTFGPARPVTHAEGLKMLFTVFALPVQPSRDVPYVDVPTGEWYRTYVSSAVQLGILPIGTETLHFFPQDVMTRGAAAQIIWNAMRSGALPSVSSVSSARSAASSSYTSVIPMQSASAGSRASVAGGGRTSDDERQTVSPIFDFSLLLPKSGVSSLKFTVATANAYLLRATENTGGTPPDCRLYKIESDGLTFQYYLGSQTGSECWLRVALDPGTYQFDIMGAANQNIRARSTISETKGDANDGFSQTKILARAQNVTGELAEDETADWYSFSVSRQTSLELALTTDSSSSLQCVIYPMKNVTMQGFDFPECGKVFQYEKGDYVVAVMHSKSALKLGQRRAEKYTVRLK